MPGARPFGLLVVDKPIGPTSHDVVSIVRRGTGLRKVGHTGTLDPLASGVLLICLGKATRLSEYLTGSDKRYRATIRFGRSTDTYDADGEVVHETLEAPRRAELEEALTAFRGEIEQTPPPYSAVRVKGKRAYDLARAGQELSLRPRRVTIHRLDLIDYDPPDLQLEVHCTAGTYLRSLAHDLGGMVRTGAYLEGLRRTAVGPFALQRAVSLETLEHEFESGTWQQHLIRPAEALPELPAVRIDDELMERVRNGNLIPAEGEAKGLARGLDQEGNLIAILESAEGGREWHPTKVFLA